jgi:hypothetical protein
MKKALLIILLILPFLIFGQEEEFKSIHQEEQDFYRDLNLKSRTEYDSLNGFKNTNWIKNSDISLEKRVFGYHPYWAGSNYLNYQWNLLTDLCFFSYEVDPYSGEPLYVYDWYTSEAVDSALANGVNVHLCVTLFSGHASFFGSATSQQTLINNVIELIEDRGAHGVNVDFEAVPSSQSNALTGFLIDLSGQMHTAISGSQVSIAAPAVNWSNTFNIPVQNQYLDFFVVMGYDYYWNGSTQAGPVSPLYSMAGNYDYNFTKTVSYYQSQGVPADKLIMGVPYYARQWPTQGQFAPSNTTGSGTAYTYRYIKDNSSGNYSVANQHLEPNSRSAYYSFNSGGWKQCFLDEIYSMGKKYDLVNRRDLAGIGIWALGYDNGYTEMWDLIATKFSDELQLPDTDTIYDSGGPAFNYYNDESYLYTLAAPEIKTIQLTFEFLDLEAGYDSLWIYDGADTNSSLAGVYSGNETPETLNSSSNFITLKFSSDGAITGEGWEAVYQVYPSSNDNNNPNLSQSEFISIYPNPVTDMVYLRTVSNYYGYLEISILSSSAFSLPDKHFYRFFSGTEEISLNLDDLPGGLYFIRIIGGQNQTVKKLIIR